MTQRTKISKNLSNYTLKTLKNTKILNHFSGWVQYIKLEIKVFQKTPKKPFLFMKKQLLCLIVMHWVHFLKNCLFFHFGSQNYLFQKVNLAIMHEHGDEEAGVNQDFKKALD